MADKPDYYSVLGITKGASATEIKSAYRKAALKWHPDRHKDDKENAEKKFKEINEAYQVLSDPKKKQSYDQFGHQAFSGGGAPGGNPFAGGGQSGRWGPFTYTYSSSGGGGQGTPFSSKGGPASGWDFGDPFDIFEQFFGGGFRRPQVPRYSITIDFMEAVEGVSKKVDIGGKKRTIKIPAGVDDGTRINFNDFILSISVRPHKLFERRGADVYVRVAIPYSLATLGGNLEVPTVDGDVRLKVRAGTQPGTMVRLRSKGVRHVRGRGRGDEYVRLVVDVPEKLNREQKKAIEDLKKHNL